MNPIQNQLAGLRNKTNLTQTSQRKMNDSRGLRGLRGPLPERPRYPPFILFSLKKGLGTARGNHPRKPRTPSTNQDKIMKSPSFPVRGLKLTQTSQLRQHTFSHSCPEVFPPPAYSTAASSLRAISQSQRSEIAATSNGASRGAKTAFRPRVFRQFQCCESDPKSGVASRPATGAASSGAKATNGKTRLASLPDDSPLRPYMAAARQPITRALSHRRLKAFDPFMSTSDRLLCSPLIVHFSCTSQARKGTALEQDSRTPIPSSERAQVIPFPVRNSLSRLRSGMVWGSSQASLLTPDTNCLCTTPADDCVHPRGRL